LTSELVAIESVNPDLVASGSGEGAIAAFVATWLRDQGLEVEIIAPNPSRPSVVGVLKGGGGGSSLMFNAHLDTVGAGNMVDPFTPVSRDGRIQGRGAYDMKGGLAAIMLTAKEAKHLGLKGDLIVTAVADEEVASFGTSAVLERYRADAAIVAEATELRLCVAHKGFVWLEAEVQGVAAHGSLWEAGVDAISHAGRIATGILDLGRKLRTGPSHPLLGRGSVHASLIEGGQELSTYPARCVIGIERRTIPGEDAASALDELEGLIADARHHDPELKAAARVLLERPPSEVDADHRLARAVASAARDALGEQPETIGVPYWMDMALLNGAGIPTVCFGPTGAGEHADVEWVEVASLEACVRTYLQAAQSLCGLDEV
jgi:acetylornithine deacetylase